MPHFPRQFSRKTKENSIIKHSKKTQNKIRTSVQLSLLFIIIMITPLKFHFVAFKSAFQTSVEWRGAVCAACLVGLAACRRVRGGEEVWSSITAAAQQLMLKAARTNRRTGGDVTPWVWYQMVCCMTPSGVCSLSDVQSYKKLKSLTGSSSKLSRGDLPRRLGDLPSPVSRGSFNRVVLTRL